MVNIFYDYLYAFSSTTPYLYTFATATKLHHFMCFVLHHLIIIFIIVVLLTNTAENHVTNLTD